MQFVRIPIAALLGTAVSCSPLAAPTTPDGAPASAQPVEHDLERAAELLAATERMLGHPRTLGHPGRAASIRTLAADLESLGAEVRLQSFQAKDPATGDAYALTNVIGHFRPTAPRQFIIGTHFDTRPWADEDADPNAHGQPILGANDGTSGVVVALALAAELPSAIPPDVGFAVVLFDGEELGRPGAGGYCAGSRYLASELGEAENVALARAEFGIVLDMVGDRDLQILVEPNSQSFHPKLNDRLFAVAARDGFSAFDGSRRSVGIIDDHTFLAEAGIPSILVIDYDYPAWHTLGDTLERIDGKSLAAVLAVTRTAIIETVNEKPGR